MNRMNREEEVNLITQMTDKYHTLQEEFMDALHDPIVMGHERKRAEGRVSGYRQAIADVQEYIKKQRIVQESGLPEYEWADHLNQVKQLGELYGLQDLEIDEASLEEQRREAD